MMKPNFISISFIFCALFCFILPAKADSEDKYELKMIYVTDTLFWNAISEVDFTITSRPNDLEYPLVKASFSNENDDLIINFTAIDNNWERLFNPNEIPVGYFVRRNRLVLVAVEEGCDMNFNYFFRWTDQSRFFSDNTDWWAAPPIAPEWKYLVGDKRITLLGHSNLALLDGKKNVKPVLKKR